MELKNRTLSNFAELVETGECKKFRGRLKTGIDLGTANSRNFRTIPCDPGWSDRQLL